MLFMYTLKNKIIIIIIIVNIYIYAHINKLTTNTQMHTDTQNNYKNSSFSCWMFGDRIDRALALTNNKLRRPYRAATSLDFGVLPQLANRVATCEKALNASGPRIAIFIMNVITNNMQHTYMHSIHLTLQYNNIRDVKKKKG